MAKNRLSWDFPGGPAVKTLSSSAGGSSPAPGAKKKIKTYCNKFNNDFKNGPHQKKKKSLTNKPKKAYGTEVSDYE